MTEAEFNSKFHGVIGPKCAEALYPKFDPAGVNESAFPKALRYKEEYFDFYEGKAINGDLVKVDWLSYEWTDPEPLVAEIKRCLAYIGFVGTVEIRVEDRDFTDVLDTSFEVTEA